MGTLDFIVEAESGDNTLPGPDLRAVPTSHMSPPSWPHIFGVDNSQKNISDDSLTGVETRSRDATPIVQFMKNDFSDHNILNITLVIRLYCNMCVTTNTIIF